MKSPISILLVLAKDRTSLMELTRIISSPLLILLLISFSTTYLLVNSGAHAIAIPSRSNERGLPSIPTSDGGLNRGVLQPHAGGTPSGFRQNSGFSAPVGVNPTITNCASPNPTLPNYSARSCVGQNAGRPTNPPNFVGTHLTAIPLPSPPPVHVIIVVNLMLLCVQAIVRILQ